MAVHTVNIDVVDPTSNNPIAVIGEPQPCENYAATAYEVRQLIQIAKYNVYEAGTQKTITGRNYYEYFPEEQPGGAISETVSGLNTVVETVQSDITSINERINNVEEEIAEIDVSKLSVTEYEKDTDYPRGRIVYVTPGQLYQAIHAFHSNNNPSFTLQESLEADITAENLTPITDSDVSALDARVDVIETWKLSVDADLQTLTTKVEEAEEAEFYTTSASFPSVGEVDKMYIDKSTGRSYTWDVANSVYQLMNTNNIVDGSIVNTTI